MRQTGFLIFLLFIVLTSMLSCEKGEPECYEPTTILTRNQFVSKQLIHIDSIANDSIVVDTLIISYRDTALNSPAMFSIDMPQNIITYGSRGTTVLAVPFEPLVSHMRYVLQIDTATKNYDTLTYFYTTKNHFISNTCGFTNHFYIDSIQATNHFIDSVAITKREIVGGNDRQVLLYFF